MIEILNIKKRSFEDVFLLKIFFLFIFITICMSCISKTYEKDDVAGDELANITFKKRVHNFGNIPSGKAVSTLFKFSNTGKTPLLIKEVTTSCGCTVPEWPKEIIEPNNSGEIKIVYDVKSPGRFNKAITVFYNGKNSPQILSIKGEVIYPKTDEETNFK